MNIIRKDNLFYNWETPIDDTRVMEYICSQNDTILLYQLYDEVINKLCNMKKKPKGNINVSDKEILEYLNNKMNKERIWSKGRVYHACSSSRYYHIISLVSSINNDEKKNIKINFDISAKLTNGKALDVGCLDEKLTRLISFKFNDGLMKNKIIEQHGIDVAEWQGENKHIVDRHGLVKFCEIKNEYSIYPYPDNNFFLITCFNVLHHIQNPIFIISEMYRVLASGGYIIIKEHDVSNSNVASLCYVSHIIRKYIIDKESDNNEESRCYNRLECWFKSRNGWDKLFQQSGFNIISHYYQKNNTIGSYYTLLQK